MSLISNTSLIEDVKEMFEGGNSLSVSWDILIRMAVENVLDNIRPETLKRRKKIYGAIAQNIYAYYAPADILVPTFLYPNDGIPIESPLKRKFNYMPNAAYYRQLKEESFTLEYINGARFIIVEQSVSETRTTIDAMSAVGTKSGGSPVLNQTNYIEGAAAVEASFTDAGEEFGDTLSTAIDISKILKGVVTLPCYIPTADDIASIEVRLKTDDSNYHSLITTADNIEDFIIDGWNMLSFEMDTRTDVGSPDDTDIAKWSIIVTMNSGKTATIIFDKLAIQNLTPYYLEYYSNRPYATSAGVLWQNTIENANSDQINFDRDVAGILHYELCILVEHAASFKGKEDFLAQLKRKYRAYNDNHPSSQAPISYSKSPEIGIGDDGVNLQSKVVSID